MYAAAAARVLCLNNASDPRARDARGRLLFSRRTEKLAENGVYNKSRAHCPKI